MTIREVAGEYDILQHWGHTFHLVGVRGAVTTQYGLYKLHLRDQWKCFILIRPFSYRSFCGFTEYIHPFLFSPSLMQQRRLLSDCSVQSGMSLFNPRFLFVYAIIAWFEWKLNEVNTLVTTYLLWRKVFQLKENRGEWSVTCKTW